ncbi:MAG: HepT-like ribonuclease domain-containing protein [Candidatus Limnocylindria bacterium]
MNDRDRDWLERAAASARIAIDHVRTGGPNWRDDIKTIDAAAKRVEEVTENLKRVTPEQQVAMPGIPWKQAKGIRELMAHEYDKLDLDILDDVISTDLPKLIAEIEAALLEAGS